ncbi:acyl-CoA dehydrogenase family protein [Sabulicella rubraurantiaca]|uniref:acyl-CoA dehydrogenase family protein n=1 Tax=Sabulicella rubraurantiaca TaxID=2811429 RepID=UPI002E27BAE7|nr:acyl-CoA dehydrogenase family protein [Sabulicella rubraurantiaca]
MIRDRTAQEARLLAAKRLVEDVLIPAEAEMDQTDEVPAPVLAAIREAGLFGISIPDSFGGLGLTMEEEAELMLVLGHSAPAYRSRYALNSGGAAQILLHAGSEAQQARWLPSMASGEIVAAFCLSEQEAGSDAASLRSEARPDGSGGWVLQGSKRWVTNAPEAGLFLVMARTGDAISAFAVPAGVPGLTVLPTQRKMGLRGMHVADLRFDGVRLPGDALVGPAGAGLRSALAGLDKVRLHLAALCAGLSERMISDGVHHAAQRQQFGRPLHEHQMVAAMLADSATEALAARCMALELARKRDEGRLAPGEAAAAKLFATEALGRVADRMLQLHGGEGYMEGSAIERLYRDARLFRILDGTSEVQRIVVSRWAIHAQG